MQLGGCKGKNKTQLILVKGVEREIEEGVGQGQCRVIVF